MSSRLSMSISVVCGFLAGCSSLTLPPISVSRLGGVVGDLKRQIAIYQTAADSLHNHPESDPARQAAKLAGFKCGNGGIDFDIDSAQLDLLSTFDGTDALSVSATGPVGGGATASGGVSSSVDTGNTQELKVNLYPLHEYKGPVIDEKEPAPISDVLLALRTALILSDTKPGICAYDYNFRGKKSPVAGAGGADEATSGGGGSGNNGNTFKIAVTVTRDNKVQLGAGFTLASLLLSREEKAVSGDTLTVSFVQRGTPQPLKLDSRGDPLPGQKHISVGRLLVRTR